MTRLEALSIISSAVGIAQLAYRLVETIVLHYALGSYLILKDEYGAFQAAILLVLFPDARKVMNRIEKHVLRSETDNAMVMKKALAEDCTMLAVAAAIVAQIAITALSLSNSDTIHWTANAAFVVSLVTASLSVFYACLLQQHISGLFTPDDVKSWLSKPASPAEMRLLEKATYSLQYRYSDLESASEETQSALKAFRQTIEGFAQQFKWKTASFNAAFMIKVPSLLLNWSVGAFILGLGVYLGCVWRPDGISDPSLDGSLGVLVTYLITTVGGLLLYYVPKAGKILESSTLRRLDWTYNRKKDPKKPQFEAMFTSDAAPTLDQVMTIVNETTAQYELPARRSRWFTSQHVKPVATGAANVNAITDSNEVARQPTEDAIKPSQVVSAVDQPDNQREKTDGESPRSSTTSSGPRSQYDPLIAALQASIEAQEQSTAALKAVLNAHLAASTVDQTLNDQGLTTTVTKHEGLSSTD
ncbi:hypothetical protein D6D12_08542 [Aureobasidium pullulans]|uniref:Uncharacterized protein n=1 Tax=Aureobasidium pullulans TaxID=5580 RepID=A0AB74JIL3_AURPU|nr:hypothetical protein D6D12_08542 [Aureobasidium pullulans]THX38813.1 hypothetical protein D6D11_08970 [Aureobasidium pullulans]THX48248.1 hypothetical protein D6D08_10084 [Aureobasidium pullulans]